VFRRKNSLPALPLRRQDEQAPAQVAPPPRRNATSYKCERTAQRPEQAGHDPARAVRRLFSSRHPQLWLIPAVRGHWAIENSLHWVLDVTFDEDRTRTRKRRIADNLSCLRRFAIRLLKRHPSEDSIKSRSRMAGWSNAFLMEVLTAKGV